MRLARCHTVRSEVDGQPGCPGPMKFEVSSADAPACALCLDCLMTPYPSKTQKWEPTQESNLLSELYESSVDSVPLVGVKGTIRPQAAGLSWGSISPICAALVVRLASGCLSTLRETGFPFSTAKTVYSPNLTGTGIARARTGFGGCSICTEWRKDTLILSLCDLNK